MGPNEFIDISFPFCFSFGQICGAGISFLGAGGSTAETIDDALGLDRLTSRNPHMYLQQVTTDPPNSDDPLFHAQQYHTVFVDETKGSVQAIFQARLNALYGAGTAVRQDQIRDNIKRAMSLENTADGTQGLSELLDQDLILQPPFSIFSAATLNVNTSNPPPPKKKDNSYDRNYHLNRRLPGLARMHRKISNS